MTNAAPATRGLTRADLSPDQRRVYESLLDWTKSDRGDLLTVGGFAGTGKGQPVDAVVMTPFGPKKMGELIPGSPVCNPDGSVAKVLLIHELGERDIFRVTFSDGASTLVTEDHLWLCKRAGKHTKADRRNVEGQKMWGRIETTSQLREYIATQKKLSRTFLPLVPLSEPTTFVAGNSRKGGSSAMPIDPYVLGALIGDGGMSQKEVMLCSADIEIVSRVELALATKLTKRGRREAAAYNYYIPTGCGAHTALKELGLKGKLSYEKFIPDGYKLAPAQARWELVRGLMDTDGTVDSSGSASYTTTSKLLALDMQWMLRSLGYRATMKNRIPTFRDAKGKKKSGRRAYTLFIQGRNLSMLFKLERKQKRCPALFNGGVSEVARRMVSIERAGRAVCRCITVDHPNGLYVTDDFIVTHNSTLLGLFAAETKLRVAYVCFTGRASSVLSRKLNASGVTTTNRAQTDDERKIDSKWGHLFYSPLDPESLQPFCGTIHRLIYKAFIDDETEELLGWYHRDELDRDYDLIVIDEASMVDMRMLDDIRKFGVRILAVGDHGQLPPVMGDGSLMANPHLRLEKIHRQAEGSPIIQLSRVLREEGRLDRSLADGRQLRFGGASLRAYTDVAPGLDTAILCWRNQTRVHINRTVREHIGFSGKPPQRGEPVIALRNYPPVYNGMRGLITEGAVTPDKDAWWLLRMKVEFPDEQIPETEYDVCQQQFHRREPFKSVDELNEAKMKVYSMSGAGKLFDFGYAMTVHKSQGSQFQHAVVVVDWKQNYQNENTRRLAYTAITRGSERLTVLL